MQYPVAGSGTNDVEPLSSTAHRATIFTQATTTSLLISSQQ
jgi:hypothetical protein